MHMPEVSGLDVIHTLQAKALLEGVLVIAIPGDQRYRAVSVAAGACAFLIKPFSPEQLEATIASALLHASVSPAGHAANA